jgi:hypothetical protein
VGGLRSRHGVLTVSLLRRDMVCRGFSVLGDLARRFCCLLFCGGLDGILYAMPVISH